MIPPSAVEALALSLEGTSKVSIAQIQDVSHKNGCLFVYTPQVDVYPAFRWDPEVTPVDHFIAPYVFSCGSATVVLNMLVLLLFLAMFSRNPPDACLFPLLPAVALVKSTCYALFHTRSATAAESKTSPAPVGVEKVASERVVKLAPGTDRHSIKFTSYDYSADQHDHTPQKARFGKQVCACDWRM